MTMQSHAFADGGSLSAVYSSIAANEGGDVLSFDSATAPIALPQQIMPTANSQWDEDKAMLTTLDERLHQTDSPTIAMQLIELKRLADDRLRFKDWLKQSQMQTFGNLDGDNNEPATEKHAHHKPGVSAWKGF
jgi:hypothetical protein